MKAEFELIPAKGGVVADGSKAAINVVLVLRGTVDGQPVSFGFVEFTWIDDTNPKSPGWGRFGVAGSDDDISSEVFAFWDGNDSEIGWHDLIGRNPGSKKNEEVLDTALAKAVRRFFVDKAKASAHIKWLTIQRLQNEMQEIARIGKFTEQEILDAWRSTQVGEVMGA